MEIVEKVWGWEHWFANNEKYCGKILFVEKDKWSSNGKYHYHKIKDETFFIIDGTLLLNYYEGNIKKTIILKKYNSFRIKPGTKHRFTAVNKHGCSFIEASTTHRDDDSYRCELIEGEWVE